MDINMFTQGYSDDLIFLHEVREAYFTHPLKGAVATRTWFDSYCCRNLSITIVGSIESIIKQWIEIIDDNDQKKEIENIEKRLKGGSIKRVDDNVEEIKKFYDDKSLIIDKCIIKHYLAIKTMRNAIIHSNLDDNKNKILLESKLPTEIMSFNEYNWDSFVTTHAEIMRYINLFAMQNSIVNKEAIDYLSRIRSPRKMFREYKLYVNSKKILSDQMESLEINKRRLYFNMNEINRMYWNNIERMTSRIVEDNVDEKLINELINTTMYCWSNYTKNIFPEYEDLTSEELKQAINLFEDLNTYGFEDCIDIIQYGKFNCIASKIDKMIRNISCVLIFEEYIGRISREKISDEIINESVKIYLSWRLKLLYSSYLKDEEFNITLCEEFVNISKYV